MMRDLNEPESRHDATCPNCGASDYHESTTVDLAFGEEIPCKICNVCSFVFAYGQEGPQ